MSDKYGEAKFKLCFLFVLFLPSIVLSQNKLKCCLIIDTIIFKGHKFVFKEHDWIAKNSTAKSKKPMFKVSNHLIDVDGKIIAEPTIEFNPNEFEINNIFTKQKRNVAYLLAEPFFMAVKYNQRMILVSGADSMIIDFIDLPAATEKWYEVTKLKYIFFKPGYYRFDFSETIKSLLDYEDSLKLFYAIRRGICPETVEVLMKYKVLQYTSPADIAKTYPYAPPEIQIIQRSIDKIKITVSGYLLPVGYVEFITQSKSNKWSVKMKTKEHFPAYAIESYKHGIWTRYGFPYAPKSQEKYFEYFENYKVLELDKPFMGMGFLYPGIYRIIVFGVSNDSVISPAFAYRQLDIDYEHRYRKLYRDGTVFPFINFNTDTLKIYSPFEPFYEDSVAVHYYKYFYSKIGMLMFDNSDPEEYYFDLLASQLPAKALLVNDSLYTGIIKLAFDDYRQREEFVYGKVVILYTLKYVNGVLMDTHEEWSAEITEDW